MPIDSICLAVRIKSAEASIGKRDLGEVIVDDSHDGAAHDTGKANPNLDALNAGNRTLP
jgi:hypothetical protein